MFDFSLIADLMKQEPGHNLIQSFLLFMIWMSSRSIKKEIREMSKKHDAEVIENEKRFVSIEGRINVLEKKPT